MSNLHSIRLWLGRLLIGIVLALERAVRAWPSSVAPATCRAGFELSGAAGEAAVRGMGVLFLMWNVPYAVALVASRSASGSPFTKRSPCRPSA